MLSAKKWFVLSLWSLVLVALYGLLMRYKIAYYFPLFEQKNMLHAHSHFAFSGWISHVLYCGLFTILEPYLSERSRKKFQIAIAANFVFALGMLVSFTLMGYKALSITFSTLSIVVSIFYAQLFISNAAKLPSSNQSKPWAIAGLLLNIFSSIGPLLLGYMIATHTINQSFYLGSIYFYLHFQYNGWFFFGSLALIFSYLPSGSPSVKKYFYPFLASSLITVFLSLLWFKLPVWISLLTAAGSVIQLVLWCLLLYQFRAVFRNASIHLFPRWSVFFYIASFAFVIKFLLQFVTILPGLSQLVFGFRAMIIAYLHLVLLCGYSVFFIGYFLTKKYIHIKKGAAPAAFILLAGIVLNEIFLGAQSLASFGYLIIPYINLLLLGVAALIFVSAVVLALTQSSSLLKGRGSPLISPTEK